MTIHIFRPKKKKDNQESARGALGSAFLGLHHDAQLCDFKKSP